MPETTEIACTCGRTRLEVQGDPIASVECCCTSCRDAGNRMQALAGAPRTLTAYGATPFVMYRKDRLRVLSGQDNLKWFRLSPERSTKRVLATCCNTPVYLEFKGGHWLSLYGVLWPEAVMPPATMRTMAVDQPQTVPLPGDIPNARKQSLGFFAKLFGAWVAMGFRNPKAPATGEINV